MSSGQLQQEGAHQSQQRYITTIEPNDVLLGRGNHVHNPGNEKFRKIVLARSVEYWSCNNNVTKDTIARQIVDTISSIDGRFLRKATTDSKNRNSTSIDDVTSISSDVWVLADMETILIKIKQTFRDFTASAKKRKATTIARNAKNTKPNFQTSRNSIQRMPTAAVESASSNSVRQANLNISPSKESRSMFQNSKKGAAVVAGLGHSVKDSMLDISRPSQFDQLQSELSRTREENYLLETLIRQRAIESLQLQQQQQASLGMNSHLLLNPSRQPQIDPLTAMLIQKQSQDQRLLQQYLRLQKLDRLRLDDINHTFPPLSQLSQLESQLPLRSSILPSQIIQRLAHREGLNHTRQLQTDPIYQNVNDSLNQRHLLSSQYDLLLSSSSGGEMLHGGLSLPNMAEALSMMGNNRNDNELSIPVDSANVQHTLERYHATAQPSTQPSSDGSDDENDRKPSPKTK